MKLSTLSFSVIGLGILLAVGAPNANAAVGCKKAGGVKCQSNASARNKASHKRYYGNPVRGHRGWNYYHHPMLTTLGVVIMIDAMGNYKSESGSDIVILGNGSEITNVYEKSGKVYFIKS